MPTYYHNEMLFSEIYLEEITCRTENADVLASLKVLGEYREYADTQNLRAWKESYVHEVLSALGFFAKSKNETLTQLFPMGNAGNENPLSLCYVVLPDENLDNTTIGRNWAEKIIRALRDNNLQWGLLTNGKQWRIYHQNEPTPYETYLEIDLEAILNEKAKEAYQIFHKFMKAENFIVREEGKCQFDRFKKESQDKIDYIEKELANALKQREEGGKGVLSDLCMGYVEELRHRNEGNLDDEALRKKIYHGAMLYMFRLLFLFYADARGLLSDENHELLEKVETECRSHHDGIPFGVSSLSIWESLEKIFVDIDQTYNGGLFSPQESEFTLFLSEIRIGDAYLVNVISNLTTYREKNGQEKPISYRDMGVRHLGTLYEGLLEHKLFIAAEDTEVKTTKGKIQFIPALQGGKLVIGHYIKEGEVYFASDLSERKSTGSYYTPEYIVDYIVRNTVGDKLKELKEVFLKEQNANLEAYQKALDEDERDALGKLLEEDSIAFIRQKVLELSLLDPAMGSGHFLVNATNLISNFVTELLNEIEVQGNLETGTEYWRRWVVENCIYGVDINPLAVELAKLSLWILSMAKDQPLSFLNHHLKCGNSLVGARLEEIGNYPFSEGKKEIRQLNLFEQDPDFKADVEEVIAKSRLIAGKGSASLEDVREKKEWLEEIDQILEGYKAICDVHTSLCFGNLVNEDSYTKMVQNKDFVLARTLTTLDKYFHWELEFPFLLKNDGFDSVIGNPPYVQIQTMGNTADGLQRLGFETFARTGDIYCLFYEQGIQLLCGNGLLGLLTSNKWMRAGYGEKLRNFFAEKTNPLVLLDFSGQKIFESATVDVNILIVEKARNKHATRSCAITNLSSINNLSVFIEQYSTVNNFSINKSWSILSNIEQRIKGKIEEVGVPLKDWNIQINYGIKTGLNEAFIISGEKKDELIAKDPKSAEIIRPILRGRDIKRYGYQFADLWLICTFPSLNYDIDKFPAVRDYLLSFSYERLEQSGKTSLVNGQKITSRKKTNNKWFETQDSISYWDDFNKQKIVWARLMRIHKSESVTFPRFSILPKGMFVVDSLCFISGEDLYYLLGVLNSSYAVYYFLTHVAILDTGGMQMRQQYVENIPIPVVNEQVKQKIVNKVEVIINQADENRSLQLVDEIDKDINSSIGLNSVEINKMALEINKKIRNFSRLIAY